MGNVCQQAPEPAELCLLIDAENWSGALAYLNEASTNEVFYEDAEDDGRSALMKTISEYRLRGFHGSPGRLI